MNDLPPDPHPDSVFGSAETPVIIIGLSREAAAAGRAVVAVPCGNPALSPTLDVVGFPGHGWMIRLIDAFGTHVWSVILQGKDTEEIMRESRSEPGD